MMANTYTQIYIQIVFAVKGRQNLISKENREELHKFITGIVSNRGQKLFAVFAMHDHVHILVSINPNISISDLVRDIKAGSSKFINDKKWMTEKFNWQEGYGAFSYSKSNVDLVVKYILNQEEHHKNKSFKNEYLEFLEKFEIEYDSKYLFEWIENN
jgi:REP element-mobilizing transposase RayT